MLIAVRCACGSIILHIDWKFYCSLLWFQHCGEFNVLYLVVIRVNSGTNVLPSSYGWSYLSFISVSLILEFQMQMRTQKMNGKT